jgi:hypothetical protein
MVTSPRTVAARMANGTLSNDTSVGELLRREATFLAKSDLPAPLYERGKDIFHNALYTECPTAFHAKQRILPILLNTLEAIEGLYEEHKQGQVTGDVQDSGVSENENEVAHGEDVGHTLVMSRKRKLDEDEDEDDDSISMFNTAGLEDNSGRVENVESASTTSPITQRAKRRATNTAQRTSVRKSSSQLANSDRIDLASLSPPETRRMKWTGKVRVLPTSNSPSISMCISLITTPI